MPLPTFDAFRDEILAIQIYFTSHQNKTVRNEQLRERIRNAYRTWSFVVLQELTPYLQNKNPSLKLTAELEALAKLTSKIKPVSDYRKRLRRSIQLLNSLVIYLPISTEIIREARHLSGADLFIPSIPDLPSRFVPNALLGWKSSISAFTSKYPFDRSVFIMIRYRRRNARLIRKLKATLSRYNYNGIVAAEHNLTDDLYNPIACLLCCSKGIAVFDQAGQNQDFNPNVAYELGMLHLLCRECKILKHHSLKALQTDILMKLYLPYKTIQDVEAHIDKWLHNS